MGLKFAIELSPEELETNLDKLPKDKLIVTACPRNGHSPYVAIYLREKGFEAKYLEEGLIKLMETLKGGKAKEFI